MLKLNGVSFGILGPEARVTRRLIYCLTDLALELVSSNEDSAPPAYQERDHLTSEDHFIIQERRMIQGIRTIHGSDK